MPSVSERPVKRSIRRNELREIVPLADSTIYEMEQPRSRRGSKAGARGQSRAPNTPTSPSGSSAGQRAGSGSSIGMVGGSRVTGRLRPSTHASTTSDHSWSIWRR